MRHVFLILVLLLALAACAGEGNVDSANSPTPLGDANGPGLTVQEALDSDVQGPILVRGSLLLVGDSALLCASLAESMPPQCGRPSLVVHGLDREAITGLRSAGGVAWVEDVRLLGERRGEVLRLSKRASG